MSARTKHCTRCSRGGNAHLLNPPVAPKTCVKKSQLHLGGVLHTINEPGQSGILLMSSMRWQSLWGLLVLSLASSVSPVLAQQWLGDAQVLGVVNPDVEPSDQQPIPVIVQTRQQQEAYALAQQALPKQVRADFMDAPLSRILPFLQREAGCPILFDERELADAAISTDTLITLSLGRTSLRTTLDQITRAHSLAWVIEPPGILITTRAQVDTDPRFRLVVVYPVADLVKTPQGDDYDTLIDGLMETLHPETWKYTGTGEGTIAPDLNGHAIVVAQSWEVHEQIEAYLTALRKAKLQHGLLPWTPEVADKSDNARDAKYYAPKTRSTRRQRVRWE